MVMITHRHMDIRAATPIGSLEDLGPGYDWVMITPDLSGINNVTKVTDFELLLKFNHHAIPIHMRTAPMIFTSPLPSKLLHSTTIELVFADIDQFTPQEVHIVAQTNYIRDTKTVKADNRLFQSGHGDMSIERQSDMIGPFIQAGYYDSGV